MTDDVMEKLLRESRERDERDRRNAPACRNCGWFAVRAEDKTGHCHRYPPAEPQAVDDTWAWPTVHRDEVCGEFQHRRTGKTFRIDPYQGMLARVAELEDEIERMRRDRE